MRVFVRSPARLHLGIIDLSGTLGRRYGSLGVAIDEPCVEVCATESSDVVVTCREGVEASPTEIEWYVSRVLNHFNISGGIKVRVERDIPKHVGLGSTTQMVLSVASAVTKLHGVDVSVRDLSALLGRGEVSGIGTAAFEAGGFIVDGGVKTGRGPPPTLLRFDFPENWFFVVVIPTGGKRMTEREEKKVFKEISARPDYAKDICHALVMKMLPALIEENIKDFGEALTAIQVLVGRSFSRYQEGIYHSKVSGDLVRFFLKNGASGAGQSSWGPTVYGLVEGVEACRELKGRVEKFMRNKGFGGNVFCTRANNLGAMVKIESSRHRSRH